MDQRALLALGFAAMLLTVLTVGLAGCNGGDDPPPPPKDDRLENGLPLTAKTAGWANTQALVSARLWRSDAALVYLEWMNCGKTGIIGEGDSLTLYYSSDTSANYYKVMVDKDGASSYDMKEVAPTDVFKTPPGVAVKDWKFDSDKLFPDAVTRMGLNETPSRLTVQPAKTANQTFSPEKAVVTISSVDNRYFYFGESGAFIRSERIYWSQY